MSYSEWFYGTLQEAARQSEKREHDEAAYRRCLRKYKFGDLAARVNRMFNLMNCKVTDKGGNQ